MKIILHIFIFLLVANSVSLSIINSNLDSEELTEMLNDDSEDDSEEENSDMEDLLSIEILTLAFNPFFLINEKPLLINSKDFYTCNYSKNLFSPPELTV
jgi:hypothetical protein